MNSWIHLQKNCGWNIYIWKIFKQFSTFINKYRIVFLPGWLLVYLFKLKNNKLITLGSNYDITALLSHVIKTDINITDIKVILLFLKHHINVMPVIYRPNIFNKHLWLWNFLCCKQPDSRNSLINLNISPTPMNAFILGRICLSVKNYYPLNIQWNWNTSN